MAISVRRRVHNCLPWAALWLAWPALAVTPLDIASHDPQLAADAAWYAKLQINSADLLNLHPQE